MRVVSILALALAACGVSTYPRPADDRPGLELPDDDRAAMSLLRSATVQIRNDCPDGQTFGSGVTMGTQVVTAWHVVDDLRCDVTVITDHGVEYGAIVVAHRAEDDIALLEIGITIGPHVGLNLNPYLGMPVIAVGYPGQFGGGTTLSITRGVLATMDVLGRHRITAQIWYGNSGGPSFDEHGRLVGINVSMLLGREGQYFATKSDAVGRLLRMPRG